MSAVQIETDSEVKADNTYVSFGDATVNSPWFISILLNI